MEHLPTLVSDLALILLAASITTLIFKWLKQPVILGYIISGFLISPHFTLLPSVGDPTNIKVWAELGIIFLLFSLGLEFSFKKLLKVGPTVLIAGMINITSLIAAGYAVGYCLGWTNMECLFLGGMLSMSSTTIIIKAFDELGLKKQSFAKIVFGILIIEDLVAILLMVLLSTMAVSRDFEGLTLALQLLKLIMFVVIWLVVGIFFIPTILNKLKKILTEEVLLILSIGMCLGMVLIATTTGFSSALGAFIMGSILAETDQIKSIERLLEPLKTLFGAVFFISVGMMLQPNIIANYAIPIVLITGVVIVGNLVFATAGIAAAGESLKTAIYSGFSLAQIGEFSFIIATLGQQLGVISDFLYPIIVAVSVITSFVTPMLMKLQAPVYNKLEAAIPLSWNRLLVGYQNIGTTKVTEENKLRRYTKAAMPTLAIYTLLCVAVLVLAHSFLLTYMSNFIPGSGGIVLHCICTILLMAIFINGIAHAGDNVWTAINPISNSKPRIWSKSIHFAKPTSTSSLAVSIISLLKIIIPPVAVAAALWPLFPNAKGALIAVSIVVAAAFMLTSGLRTRGKKIEQRFAKNLEDNITPTPTPELTEGQIQARQHLLKIKEELNKKSIHIERLEVPQTWYGAGKTLAELNLRHKTGVSVVALIRGQQVLNIPGANTQILPFDKIIVVGSDEQMQTLIADMQAPPATDHSKTANSYRVELYQYKIEPRSAANGQTLRQLEITRKTDCIITGIERNGTMLTAFGADQPLMPGDVLWLAGEMVSLLKVEHRLLSSNKKEYRY